MLEPNHRNKRARIDLVVEETEEAEIISHAESPQSKNKVVPRGFLCPLTMEIMYEPVLDAEGNTYERSALLRWFEISGSSPVSRQPLNERMLLSNNALRETIHEFMGPEWVQTKLYEMQQVNGRNDISNGSSSRLRAKIDCFLQNTCKELLGGCGLNLKLDSDGLCAFRYDNITIILDVPDQHGVFCFYTKDLVVHSRTTWELDQQLYCRALELNLLQGATRGGCLSVRQHPAKAAAAAGGPNGYIGCNSKELVFSYTDRVPEVSARDFTNVLLNFVETAVALREKLLTAYKLDKQTEEAHGKGEQQQRQPEAHARS